MLFKTKKTRCIFGDTFLSFDGAKIFIIFFATKENDNA